jgi:hypothetical protein
LPTISEKTKTIGLAVVSSRKNLPVCRGCHAPANDNPTPQLLFSAAFSGVDQIKPALAADNELPTLLIGLYGPR